MIAFVDVETTGLDPAWDQLLEVGIAFTDNAFEIRDRTSVVIACPRIAETLASREDTTVYEMHRASGLLAEVEASQLDPGSAMQKLLHWAAAVAAAYGEELLHDTPLAGNTVGFDRAFLRTRRAGRLLEQAFHYRSIDVSSLKLLNAVWEFAEPWEGDRKLHRVDPDIEDSIAELKHYREALGVAVAT